MHLTPEKVYNDYKSKTLDKTTALELLKSILDNTNSEELRVDCINIMSKIGIYSFDMFKFLENLMISDSNELIRIAAFGAIKINYKLKAVSPVMFAAKKENGSFLIQLIDFLSEIDPFLTRKLLIDKVKEIKEKYVDDISLSEGIEKLNFKQLKEIFYNYLFKKSWEKLYFHTRRDPKF